MKLSKVICFSAIFFVWALGAQEVKISVYNENIADDECSLLFIENPKPNVAYRKVIAADASARNSDEIALPNVKKSMTFFFDAKALFLKCGTEIIPCNVALEPNDDVCKIAVNKGENRSRHFRGVKISQYSCREITR